MTKKPRTIPKSIIHETLGRIVFEDVPDPDAPNRTIRRGRRCDPLVQILGHGERDVRRWATIDQDRYHAAERYRDNRALAGGAREPPSVTRGAYNPNGMGAEDVRRAASARVRAALAKVTAEQACVAEWVLIGGLSLAQTQAKVRRRHEVVRSDLLAALDCWSDGA